MVPLKGRFDLDPISGEIIENHLPKQVKENERDDDVDDPNKDVEGADAERGEKVDLHVLLHAIDDCGVNKEVGERPYGCPNPLC